MVHTAKATKQNTSHAVMSQRSEASDSLDNFPTPPWATRALLEHVIEQGGYTDILTCLEPACGAGHMSKVLSEYFSDVTSADAYDYGYGHVTDFLTTDISEGSFDWVITNPPFRLAEEFILRGLPIARRGVAVLVRTVFLESVGRYERIFSKTPPTSVAQFVERVPMVKGRLDPKASTATGYAWLVWEKGNSGAPQMRWIPPCRKQLERNGDYLEIVSSRTDRDEPQKVAVSSNLLL
ncbi:MAG: SAM-dependent methyltransferase [Rhizobiaceae bacterium]